MPALSATAAVPSARRTVDRRAGLGAGLCAVLILGLVLLWWARGGWVFPLDDAYITIHNARVLIEGQDRNYGVPALVGASSLIHLALVTAVSLVLPGEAASYLVAGTGPVLFLAGLLTLGRRLGLPWPEGTALALVGLAFGAAQFLNGLETGLVMAAVTGTLVLALGAPSRRLALACGLLPFLRPELGLLSLVLMARQARLRLAAGPDRAAALRAVAADAACVLLAAAPWLAWSFAETGALLPRTIAAKQAFFGVPSASLAESVVYAAMMVAAGLGPVAAALPFLGRAGPVLGAPRRRSAPRRLACRSARDRERARSLHPLSADAALTGCCAGSMRRPPSARDVVQRRSSQNVQAVKAGSTDFSQAPS